MTYTWGQIQIDTIQKMALNNTPIVVGDLVEMRNDRRYNIYLSAMANAANRGVLRLMTNGTPLIKTYTLNYNIPNDIKNQQCFDTNLIDENDLIVYSTEAHSYYFEVDNTCEVNVQIYNNDEWVTVQIINNVADVPKQYVVYKGLINNPDNLQTRLVFKYDGYIYNVRYVGLYRTNFRTQEEVYNNTLKQKYHLPTMIDDYFEIISVEYEGDCRIGQYDSDFTIEGSNILSIDSRLTGNFIITYKAYPDQITDETDDDYEFNLASEMVALLPLYMASELYKDDDLAISTVFRNEFEVGLEKLMVYETPKELANTTGWW